MAQIKFEGDIKVTYETTRDCGLIISVEDTNDNKFSVVVTHGEICLVDSCNGEWLGGYTTESISSWLKGITKDGDTHSELKYLKHPASKFVARLVFHELREYSN